MYNSVIFLETVKWSYLTRFIYYYDLKTSIHIDKPIMANMFKNYFKTSLSLNDYLKIMKSAPKNEKYCNAKCQEFLPEDQFYDGKYSCKVCYNQIIKARKMIDNNQLTFEQFLENPSLVEREETIIPVYRTCNNCKQELTLDKFESYRKECIQCRRGKKKKNYEEEFKKYLPGIEVAKSDIPALTNLIKGMSVDLLKLTVKHYNIKMSHEDRVKDKLVVKIIDFFKSLLNPFICLGKCGNTLTIQFSICDACKKSKKLTAEEKMIEFEKNLDTIIETLTDKKEDYLKYNKKQLSMIASKLDFKFYKTWDKTVIIDNILKYFQKKKEEDEKETKQAIIDLGGEINLNGMFKKGECFYIISDMDGKSEKNKPGFEGIDIDIRLAQHRSTTPACKLEYLIYSKDAKLIETAVLKKFENKKRNFKNHEWIFDVNCDYLIKSVRIIMDVLGIEYEEEKDIAKYNEQIEMDFK